MVTASDNEPKNISAVQIELLKSFWCGCITERQLRWFAGLTPDERELFVNAGEPVRHARPEEMFGFVEELGVITVPQGYNHSTYLDAFCGRKRATWLSWLKKSGFQASFPISKDITSKNFEGASVRLTPGRKFRVRIFRQLVETPTTSNERLEFIKKKNAILAGVHGLALVIEQLYLQPWNWSYASLDEKICLGVMGGRGEPVVPVFDTFDNPNLTETRLRTQAFDKYWGRRDAILCFHDAD
jgi:hypothetical protein